MRVLLVEDNERLAEFIAKGLRAGNFAIDHVMNGEDALAAIAATRFDTVILDLGLPDQDGLSVLRQMRSQAYLAPVLILTARDQLADRVGGLNLGADDYLSKPFAMEELLARLKALLRRPGGALGTTLCLGDLIFDTTGPQASIKGAPLHLSRRELSLLEILLRRSNKVVSRRMLEESIYTFGEEIESNALEANVSRLRRKLAQGKSGIDIHTVRGVGYMACEAPSEPS